MTEKKILPKTLLNILENPILKRIMDRNENLDDVIDILQARWNMDLQSRRPSNPYRKNKFQGTNLDLACFLFSLAKRSAFINIPIYKSMRPKSLTEGQLVSSKENRHGKIVGLTANKDVFSFSIRIWDENIINADMSKGDYRSFSITSPDGNMYEGWSNIEWKPTKDERLFLEKFNLLTGGNKIFFKNFVHPNRWTSLYGQNYFLTKALIDRLTDEAKNIFAQIKTMQEEGINFSETGEKSQKSWPKTLKAKGKSVKFKSLEVEVDVPDYINEYKIYEKNQENLIMLAEKRKRIIYNIIPMLRFATRCTELAFFKYGNDRLPNWIRGGAKWETDFKFPKKRATWDRLKIVQPKIGDFSVSIRKRIKSKSEIMNENFKVE